MVNSSHEAMHRIFQEYPGLFTGVSKVLGLPTIQPTSVTVLPTDLTETQPIERRVDTLLRFDGDAPVLLAVEAQSAKDPHKPASWAYYLSFLYTKYKTPPLLLVVCQDRATAEWAARPVPIGPEWWAALTLRPLVAGPHNMPFITDPDEARADLALAALSAITHAKDPEVSGILKALSTALRHVPEAVADPLSNSPHEAWTACAGPQNSGGTWWPWTFPSTSRPSPKRSVTRGVPRGGPRTSCLSWRHVTSPSPRRSASASPAATTPTSSAAGSPAQSPRRPPRTSSRSRTTTREPPEAVPPAPAGLDGSRIRTSPLRKTEGPESVTFLRAALCRLKPARTARQRLL